MGTITLEKSNSLFWLGRYIERVFTTIKVYEEDFDKMLDDDENVFHKFCKQLDISDNYLNDAHFMMSYLYDLDNYDSIYSNIMRAYDNAITLRETLKSETLSFVQVAINVFEHMDSSDAPLIELQKVKDNIYAFWGSVDENVDSELCRSIIKAGKYAERIDLYYRLSYNAKNIDTSIAKLANRLDSIEKVYQVDGLVDLIHSIKEGHCPYRDLLAKVSVLFEVVYQ